MSGRGLRHWAGGAARPGFKHPLRFNRDFHQHLDALKIPHAYRQLPGSPHNPNLLLNPLGEDNGGFVRTALAEGRSNPPERGTGGQ